MEQIIIATWNVSECITSQWDLNHSINNNVDTNVMTIAFEEIVACINRYNIDILCLQEFPVLIYGATPLTQFILDNTALKYHYAYDTCPSFLFPDGRIGSAIFSRYEITDIGSTLFINPNLTKISSTGKIYKSFDKGLIFGKCICNDKPLFLITGHGISFSPFGVSAEDYPQSYAPLLNIIKEHFSTQVPLFVIGDFNTEHLFDILPDLKSYLSDALDGPTTPAGIMEGMYHPKGRKLDYFLVSSNISVNSTQKIANFSDHYLCILSCSFN